MLKRTIQVFGAIVLLLVLSGCFWTQTWEHSEYVGDSNLEPEPTLTFTPELEGIEFFIASIDSETLEIDARIHNHSDYPIMYGEAFTLEAYYEGEWQTVPFPEDIDFIAIGHVLQPGERSPILNRNHGWIFEDGLPDGGYRIRKTIHIDDGSGRDYDIYAGFSIRAFSPDS